MRYEKTGIILSIVGGVSVILSKSGVFKKEISPNLSLYKELTEITYPLLIGGLAFLLVGLLMFFLAKKN